MKRLKQHIEILTYQKHPVRFCLSRFLWYSGLCRFFIIDRGEYRLRFSPSVISANFWANPNQLSYYDEEIIRKYLKKGDCVIDIGANIGSFTVMSAALVGESGKILSIEADPRTFSFLSENVTLNKLNNVKIVNCAIGDEVGEVCFTQKKYDSDNFIVDKKVAENDTIIVPMSKLDNVNNFEQVDLLKVDVEGFEKFIFLGAENTLKKTNCIYFESWEELSQRYNYNTNGNCSG